MFSKLISLFFAVMLVGTAYKNGTQTTAIILGVYSLLPLTCIWFSQAMGGMTGLISAVPMRDISQGSIVRIFGWILLLLPFVFAYLTGAVGPSVVPPSAP